MAIYSNEHLTDLLNEQYEKVRELEKQLEKANKIINHMVYNTTDTSGLAYEYLEACDLLE